MTGHAVQRADLPAPVGLHGGPIYLDYNATTPVDPRVIEAMLPYLTTHFGNPSSGHHCAEQPRRALATARQQVARLIGAAPERSSSPAADRRPTPWPSTAPSRLTGGRQTS